MKKDLCYGVLILSESKYFKERVSEAVSELPVEVIFSNAREKQFKLLLKHKIDLIYVDYLNDYSTPPEDILRSLKILEAKEKVVVPPIIFYVPEHEFFSKNINNSWIKYKYLLGPFGSSSFIESIIQNSARNSSQAATQNIITPQLQEQFIQNRFQDIILLEEAIENQVFSEIKRIGHSVKGVCSMYGFGQLINVAQELELAASMEDLERCQNLCHDFSFQVSALKN